MTTHTPDKRAPRIVTGILLASCIAALLFGASAAHAGGELGDNYQGVVTKVDSDTQTPLAGAVFEVTFSYVDGNTIYPPDGEKYSVESVDLTDFETKDAPSWEDWAAAQISDSQEQYDALVDPLRAQQEGLPTQADADGAQAAYDAWAEGAGMPALEQAAADAATARQAIYDLCEMGSEDSSSWTDEQLSCFATNGGPAAVAEWQAANAAVEAALDANEGEGRGLREATTSAAHGAAQRAVIQEQIDAIPLPLTEGDLDQGRFTSTVQTFEQWNALVSAQHHQAETNAAAGLGTAPTSVETEALDGGQTRTTTVYHLVSDTDGKVYFPMGEAMLADSIREITAPEGYDLDNALYERTQTGASSFEIAGQEGQYIAGQNAFATLTNERTPEEPPTPPVTPPTEPPAPPVTPPSTPDLPETLAMTGSDSAPITWGIVGAATLLAAGAGAIAYGRRKMTE